jgi:signal transduction histidine kinase
MIKTVLRNLLTNALKFSFQDGEIWVTLWVEEDICTLGVKDHGTGISDDKIKNLFNVGTSHKTRGTDHEPGTGLGLILCKEFVERHGGRIEVFSEEGKGSEFRIILP